MASNWAQWQFWLAVAVAIENAAVGVYVWISNKDKARSKDIKEIRTDLQKIQTRVTKLEAGSISHGDLSKVYHRINDVGNDVSGLNGAIDGLRESVGLIHQHLLNTSGGNR